MSNFEIGVKIDESDAVKSVDNLDDAFDDLGKTAKKTSKKITDNTKKMSAGMKAFGVQTGATSRVVIRAFDSIRMSVGSLIRMLPTLKNGIAAVSAATVIGAVGFGIYANSTIVASSHINKMSINTGVATETVSKLFTMVKRGGGDIDGLGDIVQDFTERLGDARSGSTAFQEAFDAVGVSVKSNANDAIKTAITNLANMEDQSMALFRGIELFGDQYKVISAQILRGNELISETPMFGENFIRDSAIAKSSMNEMGVVMTTTLNTSLEPFIASFADLSTTLSNSTFFATFISGLNWVGETVSAVSVVLANAFSEQSLKAFDKETEAGLTSIRKEWGALELGVRSWEKALLRQKETEGKYYKGTVQALETVKAKQREVRREEIAFDDERVARRKVLAQGASFDPVDAGPIAGAASALKVLNGEIQLFNQYSSAIGAQPLERNLLLKQILDTSELDTSVQESVKETIVNLNKLSENEIKKSIEAAESSKTVAQMIFGESPEEIASTISGYADQVVSSVQSMANNIFAIKDSARQRELDSLQRQHKIELDGFIGSNRAKAALAKKQEAEEDVIRKKAFGKKKEFDKKTAVINMFSSIGGAWASAMQLPYPANVIVGGATSAMLAGVGIANVAQISAQEYFANSGIVGGGGAGGATGGGDNRMVGAREGELFLNGRDQKTLFDWIKGGLGGGGTQVSIENFSGNDEDLSRLEEMLNSLQSNGRFSTELI